MLQPQLQLLVGRPMFFYGYFMPKLWRQLCRERPASPAELYRVLSGSATAATAGARDSMVAFVTRGRGPRQWRATLSLRATCLQHSSRRFVWTQALSQPSRATMRKCWATGS